MNWINDVQQAINYIEKNLLEDIKVQDVSEHICSSKDHFQKVFFIVAGLTIREYIRNRRLSLAGQELALPGAKVLEVALKYGYETPESFAKAFSRFHGCTPSDARGPQTELRIYHPITIQIHVKGGFNMSKKMITQIPLRQLISMGKGQNYWLNGCMDFLMECLMEDREYDYWFFSGVTGDSFLQMYSKDPKNMALCYSHNATEKAVKKAFDACGYNYVYIRDIHSSSDRAKYDLRIREYIDKNIPVIARVDGDFHSFAIICGYDDKDFYYILGEDNTPKSYRYDELIFVTDRKPRPPLADVYRSVVMSIPTLIAMPETEEYSFGKKAFIDWAESFQNGSYDEYANEDKIWFTHPHPSFGCWNMHGTYLCILGTNGCAEGFLARALRLNPDMSFINDLIPLFSKQNRYGFDELIDMEGGFGIKPETIKDKERMRPISEKILELSKCCDDILDVFEKAL